MLVSYCADADQIVSALMFSGDAVYLHLLHLMCLILHHTLQVVYQKSTLPKAFHFCLHLTLLSLPIRCLVVQLILNAVGMTYTCVQKVA